MTWWDGSQWAPFSTVTDVLQHESNVTFTRRRIAPAAVWNRARICADNILSSNYAHHLILTVTLKGNESGCKVTSGTNSGTNLRADDLFIRKIRRNLLNLLVGPVGLEPTTNGL